MAASQRQLSKASQVPGECSGTGFLESRGWVSPGQGIWHCRRSCWPLTSLPAPPRPGSVDDVLDRLCTLHGSGDLHRHLYFLVWALGFCGLRGGGGPPWPGSLVDLTRSALTGSLSTTRSRWHLCCGCFRPIPRGPACFTASSSTHPCLAMRRYRSGRQGGQCRSGCEAKSPGLAAQDTGDT